MEELSTQSKLTVRRCQDLMAILHQEAINEGMLIARNIKFTANAPELGVTFTLLMNYAGWQESRRTQKM